MFELVSSSGPQVFWTPVGPAAWLGRVPRRIKEESSQLEHNAEEGRGSHLGKEAAKIITTQRERIKPASHEVQLFPMEIYDSRYVTQRYQEN